MILRRPYAFLVKHFKIIHAIIMLCSLILISKTWNIVSFFSEYIKSGQTMIKEDLSSTYVTPFMYLFTILIMILCGCIIYLLRHKKKPILFYIYVFIIYTILFIAYFFISSFIYGMLISPPNIRTVNIIRDIIRLLAFIQIPTVLICFIRGIGFDVKRFDFKKDLLDLGIEKEDNEEYEFEFNLDSEEIRAKTKKKLRLFKYFYKENKFVFTGIEIVVGVVLLVFVINFIASREKIYKENEFVDVGPYNVKVLSSYKTNRDSHGDMINSKYFYVITKIRYENKSNIDYQANSKLMKLDYGGPNSAFSTTDMNSKFTEFGVTYFSQILDAYETRDFVFVFEVPVEYYDSSFKLKYLDNVEYNEGELIYNYKKIKLSPESINTEKAKVKTAKMQEELNFSGSLLGNTKLKINEVKLQDNFNYNIIKCTGGNCTKRVNVISATQSSQFAFTIMRLDLNINYDYETLGKEYSNPKFITKFGSIRFEINGKEYNNRLELTDVTPFVTNQYVFIQVRDKLKNADKIYLDFTIRDKVYTYILKDKEETKEDKNEENKE